MYSQSYKVVDTGSILIAEEYRISNDGETIEDG